MLSSITLTTVDVVLITCDIDINNSPIVYLSFDTTTQAWS